MKRTALTLGFITATSFFLLAQPAIAKVDVSVSGNEGSSNVSVNQHSSGESTTCVNGKCTTTGGDSKSTVCINGNCTTSDDGNINMQSDDGKSKVNVSNNNNTTPAEQADPTEEPNTTPTNSPTVTPKPTPEMDEDKNQIEKEIEKVTQRITKELEALQSFVKGLFS